MQRTLLSPRLYEDHGIVLRKARAILAQERDLFIIRHCRLSRNVGVEFRGGICRVALGFRDAALDRESLVGRGNVEFLDAAESGVIRIERAF